MIYLTGDVHANIPGYWEQEIGGNELDACIKYLEILKSHNIRCTVFINGKCINEETEKIKKMLGYDVELGGHTYDNFGKMNIFRNYINRKRYGCVYGSPRFQEIDISKTKKIFYEFGLEMKSWRTHAFASNEDTYRILAENGISYVSDLFNQAPFKKHYGNFSIMHMPINIPVDVTTVSYGEFDPKNRDPFASCVKGRIEPEEWLEILKKRVSENEKKRTSSILLIHPITMKVMDDFKMFERIAEFLSKYKSRKIYEFRFD